MFKREEGWLPVLKERVIQRGIQKGNTVAKNEVGTGRLRERGWGRGTQSEALGQQPGGDEARAELTGGAE